MPLVREGTWNLRNLVTGLIGVAVAALLLGWCFRRAGFDEVWSTLSALTLVALLPALVCEVAVQLFKALKWTAILSGTAKVRYSSALIAVVVGAASTSYYAGTWGDWFAVVPVCPQVPRGQTQLESEL